MSLRKRIQILLAVLVGIPFLLLLFESYEAGRRTFLKEVRLGSLQIARLEASEINLTFEPLRLIASSLALSLESRSPLDGGEIRELMRRTLHENPGIYGVAVAFDPGLTPLGRFAPYVFRRRGVETESTLKYEYTTWDWYRLPVESGRGRWIKPYFGEGGGTLMVTYSVPVRREGRVVGVAEVDLDLDGLISSLRKIRPGGGGTVYLASQEGQVLAHPDLKAMVDLHGGQKLGGLDQLMKRKGDDMTEMADPISSRTCWIVETAIAALTEEHGGQNWSLIVSWPLDARLAPLTGLARRMLILYVFLGGAALLFLNRSFDQIITRPLRRLSEQARRYAAGDFSPSAPAKDDAAELRELKGALDSLGETLTRDDRMPPPAPQ